MDQQFIYECIGYVGTAFVIISYVMTSMTKLRVINCFGCVASITYSLLIFSIPVLILNVFVLVINIVQLIRAYAKKKVYDVISADSSGFTLKHFYNKYKTLIDKNYPEFADRFANANYTKIIFCDDTVVGVVVGHKNEDKSLDVYLDFIDHNFKDKKLKKLLYEQIHSENINKITFLDVPKKSYKQYTKENCKQEGKNFVYCFSS